MLNEEKFYIHYKNKPYRYLGIAKSSETLEEFVVYECLYENSVAKLWIRPRKMFEENISDNGRLVQRFRESSRNETFALSQKMRAEQSQHKLNLVPMPAEAFEAYQQQSIREYAENKVKSGNWPKEDGLERSRREFHILLPQGINTPSHFIFHIIDTTSQTPVGIVWLKVDDRQSYLYDFLIFENQQSKGLGRAALSLVEKKAIELGAHKLGLHVFGFNTRARALYESAGFETTNVSMQKSLVPMSP